MCGSRRISPSTERQPGWLLKGTALFVIALGVSTLWQGLRYFLVMHKLIP